MRADDRLALPVAAASFLFSLLVLPATYVAIPFCRPLATPLDLTATVGLASAASSLALAGMFVSLLSVYTLSTARSRAALALATGSLAIATMFIVFGLALRACPR